LREFVEPAIDSLVSQSLGTGSVPFGEKQPSKRGEYLVVVRKVLERIPQRSSRFIWLPSGGEGVDENQSVSTRVWLSADQPLRIGHGLSSAAHPGEQYRSSPEGVDLIWFGLEHQIVQIQGLAILSQCIQCLGKDSI
jgi:hypothetical protein